MVFPWVPHGFHQLSSQEDAERGSPVRGGEPQSLEVSALRGAAVKNRGGLEPLVKAVGYMNAFIFFLCSGLFIIEDYVYLIGGLEYV